jgi:hypothetical protein
MKANGFPAKEAIRLTKFWQNLGPNTYPLDIDQLIAGIINSDSFDGELITHRGDYDSIEGCLVKTEGSSVWNILLNNRVSNKRRLRFTHAHELGHFMCHRHIKDTFEDGEGSLNNFTVDIEYEANLFAATLLMPANIIRTEFGNVNWSIDVLCELGNRFECSLQASALRFMKIHHKPAAFVVSRDGMVLWATKSSSAPYMSAYSFGHELPVNSSAFSYQNTKENCSEPIYSEYAWNDYDGSYETHYFDGSGEGYQYTCIRFEIE